MTAAAFFVPGIDAGMQEREYGRLQACAHRATGCKPADSRIRQLACRIGSLDCTVEVGQPDPVGSGDVVAILDLGRHQPYGVFTTADPEAPAFLVGKRVYAVTKFAWLGETTERIGAAGVLLAGWHHPAALPEMLRATDVVVLPSVNEAFGQVLVEGMACGRPAIAIDRGGPAEIVHDGATGWLVAGDDAPALEAAARTPEERRGGGLGRRSVLSRHARTALTQRLADVFETAAAGVAERPAA